PWTPMARRRSLTSSSLNGLMIASIFFMARPQARRVPGAQGPALPAAHVRAALHDHEIWIPGGILWDTVAKLVRYLDETCGPAALANGQTRFAFCQTRAAAKCGSDDRGPGCPEAGAVPATITGDQDRRPKEEASPMTQGPCAE